MRARGIVTIGLVTVLIGSSALGDPKSDPAGNPLSAQGSETSRTLWPTQKNDCCVGLTGNVDCDGSDGVDISDLTALIDFLYVSFTPLCCDAEANTDGQTGLDIADLSALIDYLYISFNPSAACNQAPVGNAMYKVTFDATWSAATHPDQFPSFPHFSGLIGGTHNSNLSLWAPGLLASEGIRLMAELGAKNPLDSIVLAAIADSTAGFLLSGFGISLSPGSIDLTFSISPDKPLVSLVSMIAPSPDWFVGVHDLNLLSGGQWRDSVVATLYPYDAGTDSGPTYASPDAATIPREAISQITAAPFLNGGVVLPLGTFTFRRIAP
jgi:hypothetical protein